MDEVNFDQSNAIGIAWHFKIMLAITEMCVTEIENGYESSTGMSILK